jgi:hypothetical protein
MPERTPKRDSRSDGRIRPSATEIPPASIPKTGKPSTAHDIKSFVRKILLASPDFPRLYADVLIHYAPNSFEAKILAQSYEKIVAYTERTKRMSNLKSCTHIKVTGVRCGSPPLRGEQFCYFHQRMLRTVKDPASRIHHHALLEDEESIQASLMEVVNSLLRGTIELKRAELILRALNTAVRNIRRVKFGVNKSEMVTEIPNYPNPPLEQIDEEAAIAKARAEKRAETDRARAEYMADVNAATVKAGRVSVSPANERTAAPTPTRVGTDAFVRPLNASTARVGTAAPGCPSGPEVPGRSAVPQKPSSTTTPEVPVRKPSAGVKEPPRSAKTQAPTSARKEAPRTPTKKAPNSVKREIPTGAEGPTRATNEAPKERKNAAHGASRG